VVQRIVEFMDGMPSLPVLFLFGVVASPALVVIHELGHALAALWRTTGPVFVRIGAKERRWAIRAPVRDGRANRVACRGSSDGSHVEPFGRPCS
jgi:hypothetical protein